MKCAGLHHGLLLVLLCLLTGCGGGETLAGLRQQETAPVVLAGTPHAEPGELQTGTAPLGQSLTFRGKTGSGAALSLRESGGVTGARELWLDSGNDLSDLYISIENVPEDAAVVWDPALESDYLTLAVLDRETLHLGIAAIPQIHPTALDTDTEALQASLSSRPLLNGSLRLCMLVNGSVADGSMLRTTDRLTSAAPVPVAGLEVLAHDGMYEAGWPVRLKADYDQNGLVSISDLTPIAVFLGMSRPFTGWVLEAHKRIDGDGNGEINIADLTPIGQNFGNSVQAFRLERSSGDVEGPGSEWQEVGETGLSKLSRSGNAAGSLGNTPWQRLYDNASEGWNWYRVTALDADGNIGAPSEPVLAPDLTPPQWPDGAGLQIQEGVPASGFISLAFNEDAVDDRGGTVSYRVLLADNSVGDGLRQPMMDIGPENSKTPLESPYALEGSYDQNDDFIAIKYVQDHPYSVRLGAVDEAGNVQWSDWLDFSPGFASTGDPAKLAIDEAAWEVWVSRDGSGRVTPSPLIYGGAPLRATLFTRQYEWGEQPPGNPELSDFQPEEGMPWLGGEVLLEQALERGRILGIGLLAEGYDGQQGFSSTLVRFPYFWMEPFDDDNGIFSVSGPSDYLPDGRGLVECMYRDPQSLDSQTVWAVYSGSSIRQVSLDEFNMVPTTLAIENLTPSGDLLVRGLMSADEPDILMWFDLDKGQILGKVSIPEGEFKWEFQAEQVVQRWLPEDDDNAIGVFNVAQQDPKDGEYAIELWEAHRDGSYGIREYIHLEALSILSFVQDSWLLDGRLLLEIAPNRQATFNEWMMAAQQSDGSWLQFPANELPAGFDVSGYAIAGSGELLAGWPDSYILVAGSNNSEDPLTFQMGGGVYKGNVFDGYSSFEEVWETSLGKPIDDDYPKAMLSGTGFGWNLDRQDGSFHATFPEFDENDNFIGTPVYSVDAQGRIIHYYEEYEEEHSLYRTNYYWKNGELLPGLVNGLLSEDGTWLAPNREGQWGLGIRNE
ncbi:MAG: hypothetical protein R3F46_04795 [bacterium]